MRRVRIVYSCLVTKGDNANMRRHPTSEARRLPRFQKRPAAASAMDEDGDGDGDGAGDDDGDGYGDDALTSPDKGRADLFGGGGGAEADDNEPPVDEQEGLFVAAAGVGAPGSGAQHCFVAFDLLYLNGEVLTNRPLQERREKLDKAFTQQRGFMPVAFFVYSTVCCLSPHNQSLH